MRTRGQALGLDVTAAQPIDGLVPGTAGSGRRVTVVGTSTTALDEAWASAEPETIHDRRDATGRQILTIARDDRLGHRIEAPGHGVHLVAADGRRIVWADVGAEPAARLRVLHAQVLPLAATLQGHEVLHAGAVALDGGVVAFVAPSGAGKSSITGHLVAAGADFVTDDALAVDVRGGAVVAYPGARFAGVPAHEAAGMTEQELERLGPVIGASDKPHRAPSGVTSALPLAAIVVLVRDDARPAAVERVANEVAALLAATFVPYVRTADRLTRQFEVCALIARSVPGWRVSIPRGAHARDVAAMARAAIASS